MENLSYNYAETQHQIDSGKITIIDDNIKQILARTLGLKNLILVSIVVTLTGLMFTAFIGQSEHNKLERLEEKVTQIAHRLEQDKLDSLSAQIDQLRAEVKGDQLQSLTQEIKHLEAQLKAAEQRTVEQCAFQFLGLKINCQQIK